MALVAKQPVSEQMYTLDVADAKFADDFAAGKMGDLADEAHAVDAARLERGSASNQAGVSAVEGARVQTLSVQRAAGKRAATKLATGVEAAWCSQALIPSRVFQMCVVSHFFFFLTTTHTRLF
jgi:hypothetical protein